MKNYHEDYDDERADLIVDLFLKVMSIILMIGSVIGIATYFFK
jgi:hypothetical protein